MLEKIAVIQHYILTRKGVQVSIALPETEEEQRLMVRAYNYAVEWFTKSK